MLIGWYGAPWLGAARWVAFAIAALLAVPFSITGAWIILDKLRTNAAMVAHSQTLEQDETIAGVPLPAGSRITFKDEAHLHIHSVDLPGAASFSFKGMEVTGAVWNVSGENWRGTLAKDQHLDGWPCRAGEVEFDSEGVIQDCELAESHELLGYALPPRTHVTRGSTSKPWALFLPPGTGLTIPALSATATGGATLFIANDGRLERISSGGGETIVVRGVPLNSMSLYLRGDKVLAALAKDFVVAGEVLPADTGVQIDLTTGEISPAHKNWWLSTECRCNK